MYSDIGPEQNTDLTCVYKSPPEINQKKKKPEQKTFLLKCFVVTTILYIF